MAPMGEHSPLASPNAGQTKTKWNEDDLRSEDIIALNQDDNEMEFDNKESSSNKHSIRFGDLINQNGQSLRQSDMDRDTMKGPEYQI